MEARAGSRPGEMLAKPAALGTLPLRKLLVVTRHTPLPWEDGAGAYLHDLARFLAGHGFHVDVLWLAPHARMRWEKVWRLPQAFDAAVHLHLPGGFRWGRNYFFPAVIWLPFKARLLHRVRQLLRAVGIDVPRRGKWVSPAPQPTPSGSDHQPNADGIQPWASPPTACELALIEQFAAGLRPDVAMANFSWMCPMLELPSLRGARRVCLAHDVGWKRALLSAQQLGDDTVPEISRADEARWLRLADTVIAISECDGTAFRELAPAAEVLVAPKALEALAPFAESDSRRLIFVGSDNAFNAEGLEWFLRQVWPIVQRNAPDAALDVCGSVNRAISLRVAGVTFHGPVPSLDSFYRDAAIAIVPLLHATGLNIKLVEAAAFGRAVVTTPGTLAGAPFLQNAAVVAESPAEFAQALLRLLDDPGLRTATARRVLAAVQFHLAPATSYGPVAASLGKPGATFVGPGPRRPTGLQPAGPLVASPVIYILFNRPEVTRQTFGALRQLRPARLYLIADGPRPDRPDDLALCRETREVVEALLDWECEVTRDYADTNLGCGRRLATGLTAAFALLGEAIVLEDDILPHRDFFPFCDAMLAAHRDDEHIHSISGFQPLGRYAPAQGPVVPSSFSAVWGWASWQRAWQDYRYDLDGAWTNPETRESIRRYVDNEFNFQQQAHNFDELVFGRVDTWDFQWSFALLAERRVTLVSSVNLVQNLGFTADATHTVNAELYLQNLRVYPAVPTSRHHDTWQPDRLHYQLYGKVMHGRSRLRIALLRLIARAPGAARWLLKDEDAFRILHR